MVSLTYPPFSSVNLSSPTASVGLTAVTGSAVTAMRSDGAPPLDQTAAFAFTGLGSTNLLSASQITWNSDLFLIRTNAATLQHGAADVDTAAGVVAQTVRTQGLLTGGTNNQGGKDFTIIVSPGKGTGGGGAFIVQTSPAGSSGNTTNAPVTALTVSNAGILTTGGNIVSSGSVSGSGNVACRTGTAPPAGGTAGSGLRLSSTSNFGIFFGSGTPSLSAAKGSFYMRTDGSTVNDRAYVNTDGSTGWTALVTVA